MPYVRTDQRQHRTHAQESEKRGADQRPEAPPEGARGKPHRLFDCSVYREDACFTAARQGGDREYFRAGIYCFHHTYVTYAKLTTATIMRIKR